MDVDRLLGQAFFHTEIENATPAIASARERFSRLAKMDAFSFELVAPQVIDAEWVRHGLLAPLVYFCESKGAPPPACAGVFVSLFVRDRLYFIVAAEVVAWASRELGIPTEHLADAYGTQELGR